MPVSDLDLAAIDPSTPGLFNRPDYYAVLRELREHAPVHAYAPGRWLVARYEDVRTVSRQPELFCSSQGVLMDDPVRHGMTLPGSILHMDPPSHREWRRVVTRRFTPGGVASLDDAVRIIVRSVLDAVPRGEVIDFVDAVAAPIPSLVIAELLGIDDLDRDAFRRWSDACIEGADHAPTDQGGLEELLGFLAVHTAAKRAAPGDDLMSLLVTCEVEGRLLGDDEAMMYALSLLVAGNETTRHLLSGTVVALAEHPEQRARLAAGPAAIPGAVEECLRWVTPIQAFARTATDATELGGQAIAEGDWVVLLYASANRDEAVFGPTAGSFATDRPTTPAHVGFGFGEHLCVGASLARLEARVFLEEFLTRFPGYEIAGSPTWVDSTLVRGMVTLPWSTP